MTAGDLHEIMNEIEDVTDLSDLHLHIFKINDVMGDRSFTDLTEEEEDHVREWLEKFHEEMDTMADELDIRSYDITISGGTSPISFSITFEQGSATSD